ncbi:MAG: MFS transporter [Candidatus Dormibacter sp.]|uniref:MFS transporter n=1 Tax=Candidatus Dormibacter sp. TaxID=2973982 RepID=UPI000DB514D4|nr:MAG: hypothetical protein DLM66_05830 [Candidatus Dormibacteraeota bacterium]
MAEVAPGQDEAQLPGTQALDARTLWTLLAGNSLVLIGTGFFLPILPLVLRHRGSTSLLVGLVFAAGLAGRALAQYPAGALSDRVGRRPVMVVAMLLYAALFPLYILPLPPETLIAVRFVQAVFGGAYAPSAAAMIGDLTGPQRRASAFSRLRASDMTGLLLGPLLGGLVAGFRLDAVFVGAMVVSLAAAILLFFLPSVTPRREEARQENEAIGALAILWLILPVAILGMAAYWMFGVYDTIWSLYVTSRGASTFVVGLSFATYALPIVVFAGLANWSDRLGHVRAGLLSVMTYGLLAGVYPFVSSVPALVLIGLGEGTLTAAGNPAISAEVSRLAPLGAQGRTQGVYQTAITAAQVAGSLGAGALYVIGPAPAFLSGTAVCLLGALGSILLRRSRRATSA